VRIAELADLTETTVRTIRYYHQIGLLAIPERRNGHRDYDLSHLARLVRIRWLTQAGIPLATIAAMLDPPDPVVDATQPALADLQAVVTALDEEMQRLADRRGRLLNLIGAAERGGILSPMPQAMARFYDQMHERAGDSQTRRVIRRERDFMELAFYRGDMPPQSAAVYEGFTEAAFAESSALFGQIAERVQQGDRLEPLEMDRIADAVVARVTRHVGANLHGLLKGIDLDVARRAVDLYVQLADPAQRPIAQVIGDAVLTMIEKGQGA
jgi:DNA-binding transcriptional MerR regulator